MLAAVEVMLLYVPVLQPRPSGGALLLLRLKSPERQRGSSGTEQLRTQHARVIACLRKYVSHTCAATLHKTPQPAAILCVHVCVCVYMC